MQEAEHRAHVLDIARQFLRTPYHHYARVKGVGVDCLTLLIATYEEAGLIPPTPTPRYSHQWHLNRAEERYQSGILQYAREIDGPPLPADIALWRFGRCYSHAAIVVHWPTVIHAYMGRGCIIEDALAADWLRDRSVKFFSLWAKP